MVGLSFDPQAVGVRPEHVEEFERLQHVLHYAPDFLLMFADVTAPAYRDFLIGRLDDALPQPDCQAERINLARGSGPVDFDDLEARLLALPAGCRIVHLLNAEAWLDAGQINALNLRRDALAANLHKALIWWLPKAAIERIALDAPDAWSWRSGVFDFSTQAEPGLVSATVWLPHDLGMTLEERQTRIAELRQQIAPSVPTGIRVTMLLEMARLLGSVGETAEALVILRDTTLPLATSADNVWLKAEIYDAIADLLQDRGELDKALLIHTEEQLPVYERLGDVREQAITQGKIADILQARGELDAALHIREQEELPVFERLGDVRSKAFTYGKIADILQARGDLDIALRIREQEELPVYERLGDVHSKAVTQGQIADILFARGQLDDALHIRQHEQLPVFERLGDVRSRAVTQGKIADILFARGQLDDALHIRQHEELPVYERLGDVRAKAVTQGQIADILEARGQLDDALALHAQRLPIARQLGAIDIIAHTCFSMAQIRLARGEQETGGMQAIYEELDEAFSLNVRLGRPDGIGATGFLLAHVLAMAGHRDEARSVLDQAEAGFAKIGDAAGLDDIRQLRERLNGGS